MAQATARGARAGWRPDENWLVRNIMCQCATCRHNLLDCESDGCGHAVQDRLDIRQLLNQGRNRDQVIAYFMKKYGGQVALASPIDRGFNRLAWLLPVQPGGRGRGGARLRRLQAVATAPALPRPPCRSTRGSRRRELADKLDDELRNLD